MRNVFESLYVNAVLMAVSIYYVFGWGLRIIWILITQPFKNKNNDRSKKHRTANPLFIVHRSNLEQYQERTREERADGKDTHNG